MACLRVIYLKTKEKETNLEDTVLSSLPVTWGTIKGSNTKQGSCVLIS